MRGVNDYSAPTPCTLIYDDFLRINDTFLVLQEVIGLAPIVHGFPQLFVVCIPSKSSFYARTSYLPCVIDCLPEQGKKRHNSLEADFSDF